RWIERRGEHRLASVRESRAEPGEGSRTRVDLLLEADGDVVELAGGPVMAALELAAEHEPGAEPGADREEHEVVDAAGDPEPPFAERSEIDVVLDRDGSAEPLLE